jgi:hypothetical protein
MDLRLPNQHQRPQAGLLNVIMQSIIFYFVISSAWTYFIGETATSVREYTAIEPASELQSLMEVNSVATRNYEEYFSFIDTYQHQRICHIRPQGGSAEKTFLSSTADGLVDLWYTDDNSGRQKWRISTTNGEWYHIQPSGGVGHKTFLSCTAQGLVDLFTHDDGSGRQRWIITRTAFGGTYIRPFGGVSDKTFLSCTASGLVDLYTEDDDSGRQRWVINYV